MSLLHSSFPLKKFKEEEALTLIVLSQHEHFRLDQEKYPFRGNLFSNMLHIYTLYGIWSGSPSFMKASRCSCALYGMYVTDCTRAGMRFWKCGEMINIELDKQL